MDQWESIRLRCVRDGEPIKVVARELGLSRNTVRKYVRSIVAPQPKPRRRERLLDPYQDHIDELLRAHPHITSVRIGQVFREKVNSEFRVDESTLRKYVADRRRHIVPREAFVRASYEPGDQAQLDFTPVRVVVAGAEQVVQLFVMRLSYSGRYFARASPRCDRPALFAGILGAVTAFGGLPKEAVFDNASTAVTRVLRGRRREQNPAFREFCGALALEMQFAAPARGNEKGGVESVNRYLQNNFFTPTPEFASIADCNTELAVACERDAQRVHREYREPIATRFERERQVLRSLPDPLPRPCLVQYARVNKFAEVTYQTNRYSVPARYAFRDAILEVYDDRVRVVVENVAVAEHRRADGRNESVLDPRHYLELLQHKHRAAERATVLADGRIPESLTALLARYRERDRDTATKLWMKVVLLLATHSQDALDAAVRQATAANTDDPAAIAMLLESPDPLPPPLNLRDHPRFAELEAVDVDLSQYAIADLAETA
jgi:transposase